MNEGAGASSRATLTHSVSRERIIQIHPTLACNLACRHCYSESSPHQRLQLDPDTLCETLDDAWAMGYRVLSVSGGEPFSYAGLERILVHARTCGMRIAVTTNGTLLQRGRLERLREYIDLLAVSVDGPPELHDKIRGRGVFEGVLAGLAEARRLEVPLGIIHTVSPQSWEHLAWLGRFASEQGACLLQLHPLEMVGRARHSMPHPPDVDVLTKTYIMRFALEAAHEGLRVQVDLLTSEQILEAPEMVYASDLDQSRAATLPAADLLGILVVEPDGAVVPLSYGFSRAYAVARLREQRLREAWETYVRISYPAFRRLCRKVREEILASDSPVLNWYELIVERSCALQDASYVGSAPSSSRTEGS